MGTLTELAQQIKKRLKTDRPENSFWKEFTGSGPYSKLETDLETDVVIVGGGISGVTVAYKLVKEGKKVVLIDSGKIGFGETGQTTAQLVNVIENGYKVIESNHGTEVARLVSESHAFAIDTVEAIVKDEQIDCNFERIDGYLFTVNESEKELVKEEYEACKRIGLETQLVNNIPGIDNASGIKFPAQAQFHPLKYIMRLCEIIVEKGGKIFVDTPVVQVSSTGVMVEGACYIKAAHTVVATHYPINFPEVIKLKPELHRSYVIAAKIPKGSLPQALWWDFDAVSKRSGYIHYIRIQKDYSKNHDLLICGGEDHLCDRKEEIVTDHFKLLKNWTKKQFPMMGEIVYRWTGKLRESVDSLAMIGRNPFDSGNIYIVTGDSGNGMTYSTIAGLLLTDLIKGRENPWEKIYDPSRIISGKHERLVEKTVHQLKKITENLQLGNIESYNTLNAGETIVVDCAGNKLVLYKNSNGDLKLTIDNEQMTINSKFEI